MFPLLTRICRIGLKSNLLMLCQPYGKHLTTKLHKLPKTRFPISDLKGCIAVTGFGVLTGVLFSKLKSERNCVSCQVSSIGAEPKTQELPPRGSYLIHLIGSDVLYLIGAVLGAVLAALANVHIPLLLGELTNAISNSLTDRGTYQVLYLPALKLCGIYAIQAVCTFLYTGLLASFGERLAIKLRYELFEKLIYQDIAFFDVHNSGKLVDSITADVQTFKSSLKQSISQGLRGVTQVIGSICALLGVSPVLTATLLGFLPCVFLVGSILGHELRNLSLEAQRHNSLAAAVVDESFSHIRSVKSLVMEPELLRRFSAQALVALGLNEKLGYGIGLFQGLSNFTLNGIVLAVLYVGGRLVVRNELTPGDLMSFLTTTLALQRSLAQLSMLYGHVVQGRVAFDRIFETLHTPASIEEQLTSSESIATPSACYDTAVGVRFEGVDFAYPNRSDALVLDNLDLFIPAGKVVAIVGPSGAGKSTVVSLIERFYNPSSGRIVIGDQDVRDIPLPSLRGKLVGYISQEAQIFNTTIRENIRCGRPDATDVEVETAARLAHAHEFIVGQLPAGYDTRVGQGTGANAGLSGGQRQRIAIARVLLKNAPVLLMDEATSALDADSEAAVQRAFGTVMQGRTVLIIAHRLSTIRKADHIIVLNAGTVVEEGTHDELMQKDGAYYNLVRRQGGQDIIE